MRWEKYTFSPLGTGGTVASEITMVVGVLHKSPLQESSSFTVTSTTVLSPFLVPFDPALRRKIESLPKSLRHIVGYHFGWWDENGTATPGTSAGKALRPALALLSASAVRSDSVEAALPAAVAVELVHNFSLLHDDVMDRDEYRRHRRTAWSVFGASNAVLAGDALLALASSCVAPCGAEAVQVLNQAVVELCRGQFHDLDFETRDDVTPEECLEMARGKTAALLGAACRLGALTAGADTRTAMGLHDFGVHIGLAFQLVDDLLGIWGDPARTGKAVHADLRARKKSLPVVAALAVGSSAGQRLRELYLGDEQLSDEQVREVADLVESNGGRGWAQRRAEEQVEAALLCLTALDLETGAADRLRGLATSLTTREK